MARRKSSRGRVFYYPSSLPKMQDGDKLPTNQSEYEDVIIYKEEASPSEAGIRYVEPGTKYVEKDPATGLPKLKNGGIPDRYKNKGFTKVGAKKQSTRPGKKWMVLAKKGDDYKVVHGGYKGMKDFSQHGSEDRKKKFWSRMGGKDSAKAKDPFSPLYWHKRFGTWEYGGDIQKQGYKDNSPYKNRRYIDIYSNNITMDGVSQPLQVTTDKGQQMVLPPNSGEYYFPNADAVRETPLVDLPSYFSGSNINLTRYEEGGAVSEEQVENEPNNQVIDEYIQNLMDQENAAKVGFDFYKGLWFPHKAPEQGGGFDIGYGHKIKQGEDFSKGLTDDEVLELLASDLAVKMDSAARKFNQKNYNRSWDTLTPEEQILLTDYEYNVGVSKFPKLMEAIANQDKKTMLEQYKRYSGGNPLTSRNNWTKTFIEDKIVRSPIEFEAENLETKNATPIDNKIPSNVILNAFTNSQTQDIERKGLDTIPNLIQNNSNLEKIAQAPYPIRKEQLEVLDEKQYTLDNTVLPVVGNPFKGKDNFSRTRGAGEKGSGLLVDYFDKKTGKRVGTYNPSTNQVIEEYKSGGSLPKYQNGKGLPDKADSEVYRLYLSGKHLKQGYPDAEQSGTGRLYPDAKEVSPNFEYEGDKHWNTKRFAYAPFFNKIETDGYHYRTNDGGTAPLDLPKGDKARKKMLIDDMTTYFKASGYSDEEANQQAKNYVKKEVMPLVNSKWDKQHDKGKSSIGRVDQFDAPQLYNYVDSKGEKKLEKLFYDKKENKRLNEEYIQSPKKLKRLDKDFNIKFRGLSKQDAKTEANFNYNNYKDKRYTVAQFKADKKLHGYQNGGSLPMYQKGDKIPTYMVPEVEVQAFPNATPAQRAALRTGPSNPIYRNAKSQLMNNKKPGNFTNETADAFGYLVAEGPMEVLQIPQSLLVEGIEAARGNDYNFKNALPPYVSGDTNKQRLPSQTFLQNAPFPLQLAGDILIDPFAVAGAAKGGISAARYAKNFPKAFALNLDDVGRQAFKPMKSPNVGKGFKSEINWGKWNPDTPKYPELINEYNAIEESTKKAGTWMKNPDGSPFVGSNPTKEELLQYGVDMTPEEAIKAQFIQQQSSFLKNYIKDSKLINPDGSPTIQYHGSAKKFDTFDESKFQLGDAGYSGSGIYTSPSKITANSYAMSSSKFHSGKIDPTVYHLYGQAKNPITSKQLIDNTGGDIYPFGTTLTDANKINKNLPFDLFNFHRKSAPIKDQLLDFDAAIRNQTRGVSKILPTNDAIEIVFPKNTQVKSAVGNVGFFDMTNPNIYKSVAPLVGAGVLGSQYFSDPQEQVKYQQGGLLPNTQIMIDPATGLPKLKSGGKTWIQEAIKKPGSLRATAKRAGAIKSDGTIKKTWLKEKAKGSGKTAQRARLAITLGKMKK